MSDNSKIKVLPLNEKVGNEQYDIYEGFEDYIKSVDKKFQLITVDAPASTSETKTSRRRDVLKCIPNYIDRNFAIMFDDCGDKSKRNTALAVETKLKELNIPYSIGYYPGYEYKLVIVITSKSWKFLCTL